MTAAGYVAVPETWKAGGRSFQAASVALAKAADQLCSELTAAGVAWGQGDLGRAFFNGSDGKPGFGATRNEWLPQIGDMVNVLAGTGDAMVVAGANYARAEQESTIGAPPVGGVPGSVAGGGSYKMPPFSGGMAKNDPPPAELVQIMDLVESLVAGCAWPDGSTGGMGQIRDALSAMASAIGEVITDVGRAVSDVMGSNDGQAAESFATFARLITQALEQTQQACQGMSQSADTLRRQIDAARIQFVAGLVFLAASFIAAQALSIFTFGGSEVAFAATAETEGLALRALVQMLARAVIEGLWYSAGMDAISQLSRMITGLQHGFNFGELAKAGAEGALAGAVMGGLGVGARLGAGRSAVLEAVTSAMDSEGGKGLATRLAFNSATGFAGNVASQALLNDGQVNWMQAGQFAVGMAILGEGMDKLAPTPTRGPPGGPPPPDDLPTVGPDDGGPPSPADPGSPSAIQSALSPAHPGPAAGDTVRPDGTTAPAGTAGTPGPGEAPPAIRLASVTTVADAPQAEVPGVPGAVTPASHPPDTSPTVSVVTGPHTDTPAAEPAGLPANTAPVPGDHVGTGSAGVGSVGDQLAKAAAPEADVNPAPVRPPDTGQAPGPLLGAHAPDVLRPAGHGDTSGDTGLAPVEQRPGDSGNLVDQAGSTPADTAGIAARAGADTGAPSRVEQLLRGEDPSQPGASHDAAPAPGTSPDDVGGHDGMAQPDGGETRPPVLNDSRSQTMVMRPGEEPQPFDPADPMPVTRISADDAPSVASQWQRQLQDDKPVTVATLPNDMRGITGEGILAKRWGLEGDQAYDLLNVSEGPRGLDNGDAWLTLRKIGSIEDAPVRIPVSHIHDELSGTAVTTSAHPDSLVPAFDTYQPGSGHDAGDTAAAGVRPGENALFADPVPGTGISETGDGSRSGMAGPGEAGSRIDASVRGDDVRGDNARGVGRDSPGSDPASHEAASHEPASHDPASQDTPALPGHQPDGGARPAEVRVVPPDRVEVREVRHIDARNPRMLADDGRKGIEWGVPRDENGNELPLRNPAREHSTFDVTQGPSDCGLMASFNESMRHLLDTDPQAADQMITLNEDGTVTARIYETKLVSRDGYHVAVPTGVLYEIRMTREVPLRPDGRPQYADYMPARDLMVPMAEKAMAAVDQTGGMWRRVPGDAGYTGINHGTEADDWAQVLTMWTGKPARTFSVHETADPVEFMRTIQKFREANLPVVTGTRSREEYERAGNDRFVRVGFTRDGSPIELLAPVYVSPRHAYGVAKADGESLVLDNPYGSLLRRPGEKVVVPEPNGDPIRHPGLLAAEGIPVDEHLYEVLPSRNWAALDGTGLVQHEQRAFEDALGRSGVHEVSPDTGELPPGHGPAVGQAEVPDLFRQLEQHTLTTKDPLGHPARSVPWTGAADRADLMASKLAEWGYEPRKIFAVGPDLKLDPRTTPDWVPRLPTEGRARGEVQYNTGVLIRVADEHGIVRDMVVDPLTADRPLTIEDWVSRMGISQNGYRLFDASELDQPGKAAFDATVGDYLLKAADHKLYDNTAVVYTATPDTRYPFAGAEYFGREQVVNPSDVANFRLSNRFRSHGAVSDPDLATADPGRTEPVAEEPGLHTVVHGGGREVSVDGTHTTPGGAESAAGHPIVGQPAAEDGIQHAGTLNHGSDSAQDSPAPPGEHPGPTASAHRAPGDPGEPHAGGGTGPAEPLDTSGLLTGVRAGQDVSGLARDAVAEAGEAGRAAVNVMDRYGVGLKVSDSGGTYYDPAENVIHVDLSQRSEHFVSSIVHEAANARWEHEGLGVPITSRDRAAFVENNLMKEAAAAGDAETASADLRSTHPELGLPQTERARVFASGSEDTSRPQDPGESDLAKGYEGGVRRAEAAAELRGHPLTLAERAAAGETAGREALREWYRSGDAVAPTGESLRDYYGRLWDEHHTRALLTEAGPEGQRAQEILDKYKIKVEYARGGGTAYTHFRSLLRIDLNDRDDPTASIVWGATIARWEHEKLAVPRSSDDGEAYVRSQLQKQAEAAGDKEVAYQHLRSSNPHLRPKDIGRSRAYDAGYREGLRQAEADAELKGTTPEPGELAKAGEAAGREALREWFLHDQEMEDFRNRLKSFWEKYQPLLKDPNVREIFNAVAEGRDTSEATRRILADAGEPGQQAQHTLDTHDVKLEYSDGVSTYHTGAANKIHIGLDNSHLLASSLAHEATHSRYFHDGRPADVQKDSKEQYVRSSLEEEADAEFNSVRALKAYREAHPDLDLPADPAEAKYDQAYAEAVRKAEADAEREGRALQPDDRTAAGEAAAHTAMYEYYAESRTSNTGELYPDYYGKIWDSHHKAQVATGVRQSLLEATRDGHSTSSLTRRALAEAGPEGEEAWATLNRHNVNVTYSEGGDSHYDAASNSINIDLNNGDPGPRLVYEAAQVRSALEGPAPDVATLGRDAYIDAKVRAETDATARWWTAYLHVHDSWSNASTMKPAALGDFIRAYNEAARKAETAAALQGRALAPDQRAAAGDQAARNVLYEALRSGQLNSSNLEQHQREWDEHHNDQGADVSGPGQPPADPVAHGDQFASDALSRADNSAVPAAAGDGGPYASHADASITTIPNAIRHIAGTEAEPMLRPALHDGGAFSDPVAAGKPDPGAGFTPHAEVRFGLDAGRPGKLDVSPGQEVAIGRGDGSPLRLALRGFDQVSRRHATFGVDADGTRWIRDEGSTNGTFVNGERIAAGEKVPLPDGATVRLGDQAQIHVSAGARPAHDPGDAAPAPSPAPAEVRFGLDAGRPGKLDVSPGQEVAIGRGDGSPLRLALRGFDQVSRRHATFGVDADGTRWIRDEGSTNGTFVNGERIAAGEKVPLPDGATVRLGDQAQIHVSAGARAAHDPGDAARGAAHAPAAHPDLGPDGMAAKLNHIVEEHPGLLDAPHRLGDLKRILGPDMSFDEMYALRALSYHRNGLEPPEMSRESLDEFLTKIWNRRSSIRDSNDVYTEYYSPSDPVEENLLTRSGASYMNEVAGIRGNKTQLPGVVQGGPDQPRMLTPENLDRVDPAQVWFVRFYRESASSLPASQRVYVNARADSAPALMRALVHEVVDNPDRFPGIYMAKIAGPEGGRQRADNIVIYTTGDDGSQGVISWLKEYQQGNHDAFMWSVPAMTNQVMEGVSTGAEPADAAESFGSVRANAIYLAMRSTMRQEDDFDVFHTLALNLLRSDNIDVQAPHLNG